MNVNKTTGSKKRCELAATLMVVCQLMLIFSGCGGFSVRGGDTTAVERETSEKSDFSRDVEQWVDSVLDKMTLREKVGQLVMPALYARSDSSTMKMLRFYVDSLHVGGILLLKGDVESARGIADAVYAGSKVPMFISIDAEWGLGMRLEDAPSFPRNGNISDEVDENIMYDYGREVARECRLTGINMVLGPVVDVNSAKGESSVIGTRSFGGDAWKVAGFGTAYSQGLEDGNIISVAKHFPGHGGTEIDSHKLMPRLERSRKELEQEDLVPFREYISRGLSGIMVGHLSVPALDSVNRPAAFSPVIIDGFLRDEMGFEGLVLTDALNMKGSEGRMAVDAIKAGADVVMAPQNTGEEIERILLEVERGNLSELEIREHCRRILFYKYIVARDRNVAEKGSGELHNDYTRELLHRLGGKKNQRRPLSE